MKDIQELVFENETVIELIHKCISDEGNKNNSIILPAKKEAGEKEILNLQITTKSTLGTVAYKTGGILFQHGWLRVIGSGHEKLPRTITAWSHSCGIEHALLIADDVVGGFFFLNGGLIEEGVGEVFYFAPDTLDSEPLSMGYTDFLHWACTGDMDDFYAPFRWKEWEESVSKLSGDQGFSIYPPLWSRESKEAGLENCSRKAVPIKELWEMNNYLRTQLGVAVDEQQNSEA